MCWQPLKERKNYISKREDLEEEDQQLAEDYEPFTFVCQLWALLSLLFSNPCWRRLDPVSLGA